MNYIKTFENFNKTNYEQLLFDSIISFFKNKFNFEADIKVKKIKSKKEIGYVKLNKDYVIYIDNTSFVLLIKNLFHELTHIKQIVKNELTTSDNLIKWKDDFTLTKSEYKRYLKDINLYNELPWEIEADKNQKDDMLFNEYVNSEYVEKIRKIDPNIDFIFSNL